MLKTFLAWTVLIASLFLSQGQEDPINLYHQKYGSLDVDAILASPRLVSNYVDCLLNKKPCPPEGKALKKILPEALRTKCSRCLPIQKEGALKVITALYYQYPKSYKSLRERWDPSGEYHRRFEEYLRDQKFNIIGGNGGEGIFDSGDQVQGSTSIRNVTQRPIRQDDKDMTRPAGNVTSLTHTPDIANRFGTDTDDDTGYKYPTSKTPLAISSTTTKKTAQQVPEWLEAQQLITHQSNSHPLPNRTNILTAQLFPSNATADTTITTTPSAIHQSSTVVGSNSSSSSSSGSSNRPVHLPSKFPTQSPSTWHTNVHTYPGYPTTSTYNLQTKNPVLNVINRITMKFANTAEFIAGMLRATIPQNVHNQLEEKVTSHHNLCQKFKKILWSHHLKKP